MESAAVRGFFRELSFLLDKLVKVTVSDDEFYLGYLAGCDFKSMSLALVNVKDNHGVKMNKILLHGKTWKSITLEAEPFPLEALYERINATFPPGQVVLLEDQGVISILNGKIKVTEEGVEGSGPTKAHVERVYKQFMAEYKESSE
ncbi:MAG: Lsm family RNA-binding protein [Promethearchaeota archaeon]